LVPPKASAPTGIVTVDPAGRYPSSYPVISVLYSWPPSNLDDDVNNLFASVS